MKFQFPREFCWDPESFDVVFIPWNPFAPISFPGVFFLLFFFSRNHPNTRNKPTPPPKKMDFNWSSFVGIFLGNKCTFSKRWHPWGKKTKKHRRGKSPLNQPQKIPCGKGTATFPSNLMEFTEFHVTPVSASPNPSLEWKENSKFQISNPIPKLELSTSLREKKKKKICIQEGIPGFLNPTNPSLENEFWIFFFFSP